MNLRKPLLKAALAFVVLVSLWGMSCDLFTEPEKTPSGGDTYRFYAYNYKTDKYDVVSATLKKTGNECRIWVEQGVNVSGATIDNIINEFDNKIYPKNKDVFGDYKKAFNNSPSTIKLEILILDIKDTYSKGTVEGSVAGYFDPRNLFDPKEMPNSNGAPMIYIDSNPNTPGSTNTYLTLAHEFQHLINFTISAESRGWIQDTWIDEGLSSAAEYLYLGQYDPAKIGYFNDDKNGTIAKGNNFFVWNESPNTPDKVLDDYATVYLFFQWLRIQSGGSDAIYKAISQSKKYDHTAVTEAAASKINKSFTADWESLLGAWLKANKYPSEADGYQGKIDTKVWAVASKKYSLYPGEAVYGKYSSAPNNSENGSIRLRKLDSQYVVMFNTNADIYTETKDSKGNIESRELKETGLWENGTLPSGAAAESKSSASVLAQDSRSVSGGGFYRIDGRTLRGNDEYGELFSEAKERGFLPLVPPEPRQ
jgi:hypothetical protein